jgi:hypothetical protein
MFTTVNLPCSYLSNLFINPVNFIAILSIKLIS